MAKAELIKPITQFPVQLTLTPDEAQSLADLLACVGGETDYTRFKDLLNIASVLKAVDITYRTDVESDYHGVIYVDPEYSNNDE